MPDTSDRQHTSWTPWSSASTQLAWTGPTYGSGPTLVDGTAWRGAYYNSVWLSPVFDLRPDLRAQIETPKNGVSVWRRDATLYVQIFGLSDQIRAPTDPAAPAPPTQPVQRGASYMRLTSTELAHTIDFTQTDTTSTGLGAVASPYYTTVRSITTAVPIEMQGGAIPVQSGPADVWQEQISTLLRFIPPGRDSSGSPDNPVRFWQVRLIFRKMTYLDNTSTLGPPVALVPYALPTIYVQGALY